MVYRYSVRADYFDWLCEKIHVDSGDISHNLLAKELFDTEFVHSVPHDENRAADGLELRETYIYEECYYEDIHEVDDSPCSVLEVLISLAQKMDFTLRDDYQSWGATTDYFWEIIDNLGLYEFSDDRYMELDGIHNVPKILDIFMSREYSADGVGGAFPLKHPRGDQRKSELWYQMNAYLLENYL